MLFFFFFIFVGAGDEAGELAGAETTGGGVMSASMEISISISSPRTLVP